MGMSKNLALITGFFAAVSLCTPAFAVGSPKSAGVTKNRASIEYKGARYGDDRKSLNNDQGHEFELYYGITDDVKLGFERYYENEARGGFESKAYIPNVTVETTKQGEWWMSSAIFGQYAFEDGGPASAKIVLIAERKEGDVTIRGNLGLGREIGGGRDHGVSYDGVLQGLYRVNAHLHPGVEWHADFGKLNDTYDREDQEHYVGPVLAGELFALDTGSVNYAVGYYWGLTKASADNAQRVMLKYDVQF